LVPNQAKNLLRSLGFVDPAKDCLVLVNCLLANRLDRIGWCHSIIVSEPWLVVIGKEKWLVQMANQQIESTMWYISQQSQSVAQDSKK
jgi:hypothetical protein